MAWGEFQMVPNNYNNEIRSIDESLLKLINERKILSKGKRYFPPKEIMHEWETQFDMDIPQISWLMHNFNGPNYSSMPNEPGELLNVLPIMKKSVVDGFEYQLTHSMQHEYGSIVFLEINRCQKEDNISHIRPQLLLEVNGSQEYNVRRNGSRGGGGQTQVSFLVTPRLPDNFTNINLALVPFAIPMENPPKEIILDKEIFFE